MTKQIALLTLILSTGCQTAASQPSVAPNVPAAVTNDGQSIYFGRVFPLDEHADVPTYVYERRVVEEAELQRSTHITRDSKGHVALAESARESSDHALVDYTLHTNQLGQSGFIRVNGGNIEFRSIRGTEEQSSTEKRSLNDAEAEPVVVGPTLVGYVMRHLKELRNGEVLPVRFAVLDRLESIGFELSAVDAPLGQTKVEMNPSNFIYALAIDPITFTFSTSNDRLVRLEGRVPPKVKDGDEWVDFDARVEYQFVAETYR